MIINFSSFIYLWCGKMFFIEYSVRKKWQTKGDDDDGLLAVYSGSLHPIPSALNAIIMFRYR